jgi:hypothetical protein
VGASQSYLPANRRGFASSSQNVRGVKAGAVEFFGRDFDKLRDGIVGARPTSTEMKSFSAKQ